MNSEGPITVGQVSLDSFLLYSLQPSRTSLLSTCCQVSVRVILQRICGTSDSLFSIFFFRSARIRLSWELIIDMKFSQRSVCVLPSLMRWSNPSGTVLREVVPLVFFSVFWRMMNRMYYLQRFIDILFFGSTLTFRMSYWIQKQNGFIGFDCSCGHVFIPFLLGTGNRVSIRLLRNSMKRMLVSFPGMEEAIQ